MMEPRLNEASSQTAGPYVHIGLAPDRIGIHAYDRTFGSTLVAASTRGEHIRIEGVIIDGAGAVVKDGVIELRQADASGKLFADGEFRGWGRSITDLETGRFSFDTIKPGRITGAGGVLAAPHVSLWVVARGINIGLHTRMYFSDEATANAVDPVLKLIDAPSRRDTLIGRRSEQPEGPALYTFDIQLQGERETVFFDL